jgi:UDP-N-acetylglucosamine 4,6-dehydratase
MLALRNIDVVIHAAALKRIDAIVNESIELDETNIQGTRNVLWAAMECGVRKVLFVSSDKAVQPTNAYGISKAMAEHHTIGFNAYSIPRGTACSVVRYGNVFGSTGSILHIWRKALADGQRLNLTGMEMTRFHLTLKQAVEFCVSSVHRMVGGEIFVPDLPAFRLYDLAVAMAATEGMGATDFFGKVNIVGLRPGGEKMAESMLSEEEPCRTLWQDDRFVIMPNHRTWSANPYRGVKLAHDPHLVSSWPSRWLTVPQLRAIVKETTC